MARVADALKGLTSYLHAENARLDTEFKEAKIDLAAERIAQGFQELPPDATPEMMQALQFELIGDAAALGGLQENLPLISGLHNSMLQTRSITEAERHDEALAKAVQNELGFDVGQMTGGDAIKVWQTIRASEREVTSENAAGQTLLEVFGPKGNLTFQKMISPLSRQGKLDLEFTQDERLTKMRGDIATSNAMKLQRQKQTFELDQLYGTTGARQFPGMTFLRTQTTPDGLQLYTPKKGGGVFALRQDGQLIAYGKNDIIPRQPQAKNVTDVLGGLADVEELFGPTRYRAATELLETDAGLRLLGRITGSEKEQPSRTDFTAKDANKNEVLRAGVLQQMETFLAQEKSEELLKGMFTEQELTTQMGEFGAFNKFRLAYATEQSFKDILYQQIPNNPINQIVSPKRFNRGFDIINKILTDPNIPSHQVGGIINYINEKNGDPTDTPVSMNNVGWMEWDNTEYLAYQLDDYTERNLKKSPMKTPTLEDITIDDEEEKTKINKYPKKSNIKEPQDNVTQPKDLGYMTTEEYKRLIQGGVQPPSWIANLVE